MSFISISLKPPSESTNSHSCWSPCPLYNLPLLLSQCILYYPLCIYFPVCIYIYTVCIYKQFSFYMILLLLHYCKLQRSLHCTSSFFFNNNYDCFAVFKIGLQFYNCFAVIKLPSILLLPQVFMLSAGNRTLLSVHLLYNE